MLDIRTEGVNMLAEEYLISPEKALINELETWWAEEQENWDNSLETESENDGSSVWDSMPMYDSKAVARSSPIFEKHLGIPLDISLIRPGGYDTMEEMIRDLVPKALEQSLAKKAK